MAKRYELGVLDIYPIAVKGTLIEDSPTVGVALDEEVDAKRLEKALHKTIELFPLFKTKIIFDKGYYLEENNNPILIFNEDDYHKTFTWKQGTNEYPWKLSYYGNRVLLRWCHAITDGRGAKQFLETLLKVYYEVPVSIKPQLELGLESLFDKNEKGIPQKKQEKGFGKKGIPVDTSNTVANCHLLKCKSSEILALAKRSDASPATVVPPLFSMALRKCMKEKRNVKFGVVIDVRGALGINTMHNCILSKEITYTDQFDTKDFELVSTIYRTILSLATEKENIVVDATNNVKEIGILVKHKIEPIIKLCGKVCGLFMKSDTTDATFSYLGKIDIDEKVNKHIKNFIFMSWPDFGYCNIAASEFKGEFTMCINEVYRDKTVIPQFIREAKKLGVNISEVDTFEYRRDDK